MFYPNGDDQLRCRETLSDNDLTYIINSRMLYEHFVREGFKDIRDRGIWFEPAFPLTSYFFEEANKPSKFRLLCSSKQSAESILRGIE